MVLEIASEVTHISELQVCKAILRARYVKPRTDRDQTQAISDLSDKHVERLCRVPYTALPPRVCRCASASASLGLGQS